MFFFILILNYSSHVWNKILTVAILLKRYPITTKKPKRFWRFCASKSIPFLLIKRSNVQVSDFYLVEWDPHFWWFECFRWHFITFVSLGHTRGFLGRYLLRFGFLFLKMVILGWGVLPVYILKNRSTCWPSCQVTFLLKCSKPSFR